MARNVIQFAVRVKDDASHNIQKITKETNKLSGSFKRLAAAAISITTFSTIARQADVYRLLQNRLRLVTRDTLELNRVTNELIKISIRSRTSFQSTADLYARVARSSRQLGLSQQELLDFTETVSKSIRISGSTAQEAAAGVIQFGQALASSRLSGDELRSVLEQMPRLAQAIAEGMGVGIGRLREMGEAGELTADRVLDALRKAGPDIEREFSHLIPIVSEAFTNLNTSITATIGRLDEFFDVSTFVAAKIISFADDIIILSKALTDSLEPGDKVSTMMQRLAIFVLVTAGAFRLLWDSMTVVGSRQFKTLGEFLGALSAQIATGGSMDQIDAISEAFNEKMDDIWDDETMEEARARITMNVTNMMEQIGRIMGELPLISGPNVDLTGSSDAANDIGRKQRTIIRRASEQLAKMKETLIQQQTAMFISTETGRDFAEVLNEVKIASLGITAQLPQAANDITAMTRALQVQKDVIADATALKVLMKEIELLGQTARQRFVNLRLMDLTREATLAEIAVFTEQAGKLFDVQEELANKISFMENLAEQAARNIQDAFAEFLFDPFEEGVRGMLLGFVNALRTMFSQALAFRLLNSIPGLSSFFSAGSRAAGGPVIAGMPVLVHAGESILIPGRDGTVRNKTATAADSSGAPTFITHIDARGADPGLIARLPEIMEQRDRMLLLKVKEFFETGSVTI